MGSERGGGVRVGDRRQGQGRGHKGWGDGDRTIREWKQCPIIAEVRRGVGEGSTFCGGP